MDHLLDFETVPGPVAGTALLTALGVPTVSAGDRVTDWGVAVIGAGAARDCDFGVHHGSCQRAVQQISVDDLVLIQEAACDCDWMADVAVTDLDLATTAVQNLTHGFYNALFFSPPRGGRGLLAERRAVHFGGDAAQVLEDFLTANTPRRYLEEAIRHCARRMRRYAHEAGDSLRRDGMTRLQDLLEREYADGHRVRQDEQLATAGRRRTALADAETAVPGADGGSVVCFYRQLEPYIDTAVAASGSAAYALLPRRSRQAAVGILPRHLAVLLYADFQLTHHIYGQSLVFAAPVEARLADQPNACRVAARLWSGGTNPELAWQAAVATVY